MLSSGERPSRRSWALRYSSSSCERMLAGAYRGFTRCPPANEVSSEVRSSHSHQLRRSKPEKELAPSSGERPSQRSWALRYSSSSCKRMLAGVERGSTRCPPTNKGSPEVRVSPSRLLRRNNPNRSWPFPPMSAPLNGAGLFGIRLPPASESALSSGKTNPNRNWCLPPVSALLNGVGLFGIRLPPITGS